MRPSICYSFKPGMALLLPKVVPASMVAATTSCSPCELFEACESSAEKEALMQQHPYIKIAYLKAVNCQPTAGNVLQRCKQKLERLRAELGSQICVYKIGYTSNPIQRFRSYELANFSVMLLLHVTPCRGTALMLEAALIDLHLGTPGCRNEKPGGEGGGHIEAHHFYVYVVAARADQFKPIGG